MKPALAFRKQNYPECWNELPNGELILKKINQTLSEWCPKFFGYHLLKIGALSGEVDCSTSPIKHQVTLGQRAPQTSIVSDIDDLPCLEHSVDVCLLSHVLEFTGDPHHVVREANRVLIPNGYLVITGYNPFSLAGLNKLVPYRRKQSPWNERFFSAMRVKDWLHLMGYEILTDEYSFYSALSSNVSKGKISSYWSKLASKFIPQLGSVYIIVARKRRLPLTPIKPKWSLRPDFSPVKVPGMSSNHHNTTTNKKTSPE